MSVIDRILEQRLDRPEAGHLVEDLGDEFGQFLGVEREPLDQDVLRDELLDVLADLLLGQLFQRRQVDLLDQAAMQAHLGVEQLVGQQRIGIERGGRRRRLGGGADDMGDGGAAERRVRIGRAAPAAARSGRPGRLREHGPGDALDRGRRFVGRHQLGRGTSDAETTSHALSLSFPFRFHDHDLAQEKLSFFCGAAACCAAGLSGCGSGAMSFFSCRVILLLRLDLVERHAAVDRLAHQAVVVRHRGRGSPRRAPARCRSCAGRRRTAAARSD